MPTNIITTDDLREFKMELLDDIKELLSIHVQGQLKQYLTSSELMANLKISKKTLYNLRLNCTLPYTKIGGTILYDFEKIQNILDANRKQ